MRSGADGPVDRETIAAIATAPGQAGVGIVRVSGRRALQVAGRLTPGPLEPRRVTFRSFRDAAGEVIDSGVVVYFAAPASYTGEDVVEFQGHGGTVVVQMVLDAALAAGARLANPGEFTERAYLNGKLDLTQAEAVADLISGASEAVVRGANRSLAGEFSQRVHRIDRVVVELRLFVEAAIDFPDDDIDLLADGQIAERTRAVVADLARLRDDCAQGVLLRDGIALALVGAPNVGKSSLLNRLAGESRAIVTDVPGTTRDLVRAELNFDGLCVEVVDTAGLRAAGDQVEAEGIARAQEQARQADILLLLEEVGVSRESWHASDYLEPEVLDSGRVIRVLNKLDLVTDPVQAADRARAEGLLPVSAESGQGIEELRQAIRERAGFLPSGNLFTARRRHLESLDKAADSARRALALAEGTLPGELVAEELRFVHGHLGDIVGEMSSDELLGEIFSRFCIGK